MIYIILALITGILVKIVDMIIDDKKKIFFKHSEILFGAIYGILIGFMISFYPTIAPIWIGITIGCLIMKKFDGLGHLVALPIIIITILFFKLPKFSIPLTILFILVTVFEELLNDFLDKKTKNKMNKSKLLKVLKMRPLAEITALAIAILTLQPEFFFALFALDIGYIGTKKLLK